jgi:hypothetical protein
LKQSFKNIKLFLKEGGGLENNFLLPQAEFIVILGQNFLLPQAEFLVTWGQNFLLPEAKFLISWNRISCCLRQNFSPGTEFLIALGGIYICGDCS